MGFFEKFKKRKFWKKRRDRGKKGESNKEDVEPNVLERSVELQKKLEEKDATICGLEEILQEQNIQRAQVEATLRGQIKELEKKVKEEYDATLTLEIKLLLRIRDLRLKLEETDSDKKEAESDLRRHREYYERKQQERDTKIDCVENALYWQVNRQQKQLEEKDRAMRKLEVTLHQLQISHEETRLEKNTAIRVIKRLKAKVREKELRRETVEANKDCIIKELSKKLEDTKNEKKEVECALRGKMKKLVAFAAAAVVSVIYIIFIY